MSSMPERMSFVELKILTPGIGLLINHSNPDRKLETRSA